MSRQLDTTYINYDLFADDKDRLPVRMHNVKLVKTRKEHQCVFLPETHTIPAGTIARREKAIVDNEWKSFYCCLDCMDRWFKEINY